MYLELSFSLWEKDGPEGRMRALTRRFAPPSPKGRGIPAHRTTHTKTIPHPATGKSDPSTTDPRRESIVLPAGRLARAQQCHPHRLAGLPSTRPSADTKRCSARPDIRQNTYRAGLPFHQNLSIARTVSPAVRRIRV